MNQSTAKNSPRQTHDVDHGRQEVDEDGDEDEDVARRVRLVDPAAGPAQRQREALVVLRRGHQDQNRVEQDQNRELDRHGQHPAGRPGDINTY